MMHYYQHQHQRLPNQIQVEDNEALQTIHNLFDACEQDTHGKDDEATIKAMTKALEAIHLPSPTQGKRHTL